MTRTSLRKVPRFEKDFLLLIDPTDKKRNVAASISERAWIYCLKQINEFLKDPDPRRISEKLKPSFELSDEKINAHFVVVETIQTSDSHYTKIRDKLYSIGESIKSFASYEFDHSVRFPDINFSIYFNPLNKRFSLAFYTSQFQINNGYQRRGPRTDRAQNFEKFKKKHPDLIVKDGYSYVIETRKYTNFLELINTVFNERMFKEIELLNISTPSGTHTEESLMAVHILKECILPYQNELDQIIHKVIPKKTIKKR